MRAKAGPRTGKPVLAWLAFCICLVLAVPEPQGVHASEIACDAGQVQMRWENGRSGFYVELALDSESQARGLMHRKYLAPFSGMLFVFPAPKTARFWMKDTLIPLDILFFDHRGVLKTIHENAVPHSRASIEGGDGIQFVLEINGGMVEELGIPLGTELRHPSIESPDAAWPCQ